jgi:elongation factor Ts
MIVMTAISALDIKSLREQTGAGMMDCKKALTECNGDMEAATDWLRAKGLAAAAKKAGRVAAEGLIGLQVEGNSAALVEVNSETDFVARNDQFQSMVTAIAACALKVKGDLEQLKTAAFPGTGRSVTDEIAHQIGVIGENMNLRRTHSLSADKGVVASYLHNSVAPGLGKIGVLVALESEAPRAELEAFGRQIAMHIAAAKPEAMRAEQIEASKVERERAVLREKAQNSGKPADIIEKMVEGGIRKYFEEVILPEQIFVIDGKAKVKEAVAAKEKELGKPIVIRDFCLFVLGDGIEKEESDFAAEVSAMAGAR